MKQKSGLTIGFVLFMAVILIAGCSTTTGQQQEEQPSGGTEVSDTPQVFTFAGHNDIVSLDVSSINDEMSAYIMYAVNEGLVRFNQDEVAYGMAERYEVSDDGLVYTFYLREATWSDGVPVTAGDFEYSFFRTLDPETGSSQTNQFDSILNAKAYYSGEITDRDQVGIKALDDHTLEITLENSDPFFIYALAQGINFYPVRQDYVEQYGAEYGSSPDTFIGNGPFVLKEWVTGASLELEKNPAYWDADNIKLDQVVNLIIPDENTRVGMFELKEVDALFSVSATQAISFPDEGVFGVKTGGTLQYLALNSAEGNVLSNQNLRKALSYAIDRSAIVSAIASPGTEVSDRMIEPTILLDGESVAEKYPNSTGVPENGDVEQAKAYLELALEELGYSDVSELPVISYVCMDSTVHKQYAEALQERWNETLGVQVSIDILPVPQAIGSLIEGSFDIFLVSQSTGVNPNTLLKNYTIGNGNNYSNWEHEAYSELIQLQAHNLDIDESLRQLQQAEAIILEEAPVVPLWTPGTAYFYQDYVRGLHYGRQTGSIEFIYAQIEK